MLPGYYKQANIGIGIGLLGHFGSRGMASVAGDGIVSTGLAFVLVLVGIGGFIWGCRCFAIAKGYHGVLGMALGLISILGVVIIALLPDKERAPVHG